MSYGGLIVAASSSFLIALAILLELSAKRSSPYLGMFTYMILPAGLLLGLAVTVVGMRFELARRKRAGTVDKPYPAIDLNDPATRRRFGILAALGTVLLVVLSYTGYNGFLLTESVEFCGKTCHTQMGPEMTAYENSPHARVRCVECHVGGGAGPYVHSKVNGVAQMLGVLTGKYDKPIPTPIEGLRPARETCQECHWQQKYWGSQLYQRAHFRYDEKSTPDQISMLMKTGGGGENGAGIHWHMMIENEVTFAVEDDHLQEIPWVKVKRRDGSETEYFRSEKNIDAPTLAGLKKRVMDCMDCHNRPAHTFEAPDVAVDRAHSVGTMSQTLPWVKSLSVDGATRCRSAGRSRAWARR